ncbi:MAG: hypothetical protein Fur0037_03340 [Planctomycetota bacterium]
MTEKPFGPPASPGPTVEEPAMRPNPPLAQGRPSRALPLAVAAAGILAVILLSSLAEGPRRGRHEPPADEARPAAASAAEAVGPGPERRELPVESDRNPAREWTFELYVEEIVRLGTIASDQFRKGDEEAAKASDQQARDLFAEMIGRIADADERGLAAMAGAEPPEKDAPVPDHVRWLTWSLCVDSGLQRRKAEWDATRERRRLDALVTAILRVLPANRGLAEDLGQRRLVDHPYLGAAHEAAVLDLASLAATGGFDGELAADLLLTLWRNLVAEGLRDRTDIARQALLLLQDRNPALRAAASRLLLGEERFREVVLQQVRETKDADRARSLAMAAARDLEPKDAVEVLRRLKVTAGDLMPAFLMLGTRAKGFLADAYQQSLALDIDPSFRADLVTGAGFCEAEQGIRVAKEAFASDPSPEVRTRAMFVLTANAAEAVGEQTINAAIDDAIARDDSKQLGAAVLALENLERAGQINAIDRLGQRLRLCAGLRAGDRETLEAILARALPGGRTSR